MSFPTANYKALTLANAIASAWSLTGSLAPFTSYNPSITSDPVFFYGHPAFGGEVLATKAVIVRSMSPIENVVEHPTHDEVRDVYQVECYYALEGEEKVIWDNAESNIEAMENEVLRIIKLNYDPAAGVGTFFSVDRRWENRDEPTVDNPEYLRRVLTFTLIKFRSRINTVFKGYGGQIVFDVTNSQGNSLPVGNYQYTECFNVRSNQGYQQIPRRVTGHADGPGIPALYRGAFNGLFEFKLFAKVADIAVTDTSKLNNIFQLLSSGEVAKIFLIDAITDTSTPKTMTTSTKMKVINFSREWDLEHLVVITIQARIIKPSVSLIS